jgi:hypothetical protein
VLCAHFDSKREHSSTSGSGWGGLKEDDRRDCARQYKSDETFTASKGLVLDKHEM